jgi:hypothetical protein
MSFTYEPLLKERHEIRLLRINPIQNNYGLLGSILSYVTTSTQTPTLSCTLEHVRLTEAPEFTALSYMWGDPTDTRPILLHGCQLPITKNLHEALSELSRDPRIVYIWADALCINQANDAEKSWQVQMMRQIYQRASNVIAWLGPAFWLSQYHFDKLQELGTQVLYQCMLTDAPIDTIEGEVAYYNRVIASTNISELDARDRSCQQYVWTLLTKGAVIESIGLSQVKSILASPFWSRVWTLQEFVLSTRLELACGPSRISVQQFSYAVAILQFAIIERIMQINMSQRQGEVHIRIQHVYNLFLAKRRSTHQGKPSSLFELLVDSCGARNTLGIRLLASDARDTVLALLNLAADVEKLNIEPDYSKTTRDVFIETSRVLIEAGHPVLIYCMLNDETKQLPSWVPDWTRNKNECKCLSIGTRFGKTDEPFRAATGPNFDALSFPPSQDEFNLSADAIVLYGVQVGIIRHGFAPNFPDLCSDGPDSFSLVRHISSIQRWFQAVSNLVFALSSSNKVINTDETLWRTIFADRALGMEMIMTILARELKPNWRTVSAAICTAILHEDFSEATTGKPPVITLVTSIIQKLDLDMPPDLTMSNIHKHNVTHFYTEVLRNFLLQLISLHKGRVVFATMDGFAGVAPDTVREGDVVAILRGQPTPVILRQFEIGKVKLIGDAYVDGVVDGEFVPKERVWKRFVLY